MVKSKLKSRVKLKSENIYKILDRMNRTAAWLAHKIDLHPTYMYMMLNHKRFPSSKTRVKITKCIRGDWDDLFEFED